jgi:hypothetical protein
MSKMYSDLKKLLLSNLFYKKTDKSLYPRTNTGNPQVVMRSEIKTLISFWLQIYLSFLYIQKFGHKLIC